MLRRRLKPTKTQLKSSIVEISTVYYNHILSEDELSNFEGSLLSIEEGQSAVVSMFEQLDAIDNIEDYTRKISLRQNRRYITFSK